MFFIYRTSTAKYTFAAVGLLIGCEGFFVGVLTGVLACIVLTVGGYLVGSMIQNQHDKHDKAELESLMAYARSVKQQAEAERAKSAAERT
jgi:uncharacterized membrane protein YhiD involved in acid resistance